MKVIFEFLKPYKKLVIFVLLVMVLDVAGGLLIPTITANIINNGVSSGDMDYIIRQGLLMVGVSVVTGFGALAGSYLCASLSSKVGRDIRNAIYDKSLEFSSSDMEQFGTGSMITRTLNDVNVLQQGIVMFIQMVLPVPVVCAMGIVMGFMIDSVMGGILTVVTVVILIMAFFIMKKATPLFEKLQSFLDRMNVVIRENITGVRVIRAFNKEPYEEKRMKGVFGDYADVSITVNRLFAGLESTALLAINLIIVAVLYIGGNRIGAGFMEIGDITAITEYAIMILFYLIMAQMVLILLPRAMVCLARIKEILVLEPEIKDGWSRGEGSSGSEISEEAGGESGRGDDIIAFKDVSFRFADAEEETLSGLNFTCRRGETTAIIGSTGSGKSTIAKLILRFHDVTGGEVTLNGRDVRDMDQSELRSKISYVPQKAWLFSGTVEDNLRHGDGNASEAEINRILSVAQADFVKNMEGGIKTPVSQGGTNFSGGQKQRLSIARALMKKGDLYIFDDSFSALDFKTDAALRKALKGETENAAVLIIAQRINTILSADKIIVLDDGRVAGIGTHDQLMKECEVYRDIAKSQMKGGEIDG